MKVTIDCKINGKNIQNNLDDILDSSTRIKIQEMFAKSIEPYTPFWHGYLSNIYEIDETGITYLVPYAKYQYYFSEAFHKDQHPLATRQWDIVAFQTEGENIKSRVKEIIKERVKQLYG